MEFQERIFIQEQEKITIEQAKIRQREEQEEERIMLQDTTGMPPMLENYYEGRQMEILAKRMGHSSNSEREWGTTLIYSKIPTISANNLKNLEISHVFTITEFCQLSAYPCRTALSHCILKGGFIEFCAN